MKKTRQDKDRSKEALRKVPKARKVSSASSSARSSAKATTQKANTIKAEKLTTNKAHAIKNSRIKCTNHTMLPSDVMREKPLASLRTLKFKREIFNDRDFKGIDAYWMGKGVNYKKIWDCYLLGKKKYEKKFDSYNLHQLNVKFSLPAKGKPVFAYEAVYQTLKGLYYEVSRLIKPPFSYKISPLFLYGIERGSCTFVLLGEGIVLTLLAFYLKDEWLTQEKIRSLEMAKKFADKCGMCLDEKSCNRYL